MRSRPIFQAGSCFTVLILVLCGDVPAVAQTPPTCSISGPDSLCGGTPGNVYTSTVSPSGGTVTYFWSISGNGIINGSAISPSVIVDTGAAGSFTVHLDVTRNGVSGSCSKAVSVKVSPTCTISGPDSLCADSTVAVYASTESPPGGLVTYSWLISGNGMIIGSTTGPSVTVDVGAAGSFTLTLNVTRNGCPGICSKTVTVSALPTCTISGPGAVCAGTTGIVYTATVSPAGGSLMYFWSIGGNGSISFTNGPSVTVTAGAAAGSFALNLNVIRNGCPGFCSKGVTVNANPICSITGPSVVCAGSTGHTFAATVSPSGGTVTYAWSTLGNGSISGPNNGSLVLVNAGAAGTFTIRANVTRNGCPATCEKIVTINANPICTISGANPVCAFSLGHVYTASVSPSGGTVTYLWSITGNGSIPGSKIGSSVTVNAGAGGSFTLTLNVTRNACPGVCQDIVVVRYCLIGGGNYLLAGSLGNTYTSSVSPGGGTVTYSWSISGNGAINGSTSDSLVTVNAGAAGSFILALNAIADGCSMACSKTVTVLANTAGGDDPSFRLRLVPAPNPFSSSVDLHFTLDVDTRVILDIYDLSGRSVSNLLRADMPKGEHEASWDGRDWHHQPVRTGIYFVRLETGDGRAKVVKLFKSR